MSAIRLFLKNVSESFPYKQIVIVFATFALMTSVGYFFGVGMDYRRVERESEFMSHYVESELSAEFRELEALLGTVSLTVRNMIFAQMEFDIIKEYTVRVTADARNSDRYIGLNNIFILFKSSVFESDLYKGYSGISGLGWDIPPDFPIDSRRWYILANELLEDESRKGDIVATEPYWDEAPPHNMVFAYAKNIFGLDGEHIGIVCLNVELDAIHELAYEDRGNLVNNWMLFDSNLNMVAHYDSELVGVPLHEITGSLPYIAGEIKAGREVLGYRGENHLGETRIMSVKRLDNGWYLGVTTLIDGHLQIAKEILIFLIFIGLVFATGLSVILTGISMRQKKADKLLFEANEYSQLMTEMSPVGITIIDKNFNLFDCNDKALEMFGVDKKNKMDFLTEFFKFMPKFQQDGKSSVESAKDYLKKTFDEGSVVFEFEHQIPNGEIIPCEITAARAILKNSPVVVSYMQDLRRLKEYLAEIEISNERLRRTRDAAEEANRTKSAFLANMSHEIRTPMNSIIGFSELAQFGSISQETREYLLNIQNSGEWLLKIINDILDISKIESGRIVLEHIPFDLSDIFEHCQALITPRAKEKDIALYCYAEPSVGKRLLGDPVRLRQVLTNLLSNAVKFTNVGMVKILAAIESKADDSITINFEVKDSGIGMSPEQIAKVFEPFIQGDDSITRRFGGTGLGLAITKSIIELMGGTLKVESALGVGSRFNFTLTFEMIDDIFATPIEKITFDGSRKPNFSGEVLVCEDNGMNQQVICDHLARVGLKAVVANDGKEGVDLVKQRLNSKDKMFDIILMDIHMPIMDGIEAAQIITELCKKQSTGEAGIPVASPPIVAVTANIMSNDLELYRKSGMSDCVGKPFTAQELWRCLIKFLNVESFTDMDNQGSYVKNEKVRNQLKATFAKDNQNTFSDFKKKLSESDVKTAHRIVHSLKSNAGQIGERQLQLAAVTVETALLTGENAPTQAQIDDLEKEMNAVLERLKPHIHETGGAVKPQISDPDEIRDLFLKLKPLLESSDTECFKLLDDVRAVKGTKELVNHIEEYDFKKALESLETFKEMEELT